MAAALAQAIIATRGLPWRAESAGLHAAAGQPITPLAAQALTRRQIPLTPHRARAITEDLVAQADFIFCMTDQHAAALRSCCPDASHKVRVLGACGSRQVDAQCDIVDPFGGSDADYEHAAHQIEQAIVAVFAELEGRVP